MLAKLFVIEKIELGGITRENLDVIEGEFQYLHLATNVHEKFIVASDFYRRLGDIMYYKNGLIGFNFKHKSTDENSEELSEIFIDSLYYYGFDIKKELHAYCRKNNCFQYYSDILCCCRLLDNKEVINKDEFETVCNNSKIEVYFKKKYGHNNAKISQIKSQISGFLADKFVKIKISKIHFESVVLCNKRRKQFWIKNCTLPCYACRYYHQSLEILMNNWIGVGFQKSERKAISVLRQIVLRGSAESSRQNFNLQFAEVLDTLGNTMFSCSSEKDEICADFLTCFIHDARALIEIQDNDGSFANSKYNYISEFLLLKVGPKNNLETALLYYLEASFLFRVGSERKKAVGSLHKIIKILLNYLRVCYRNSLSRNKESNSYKSRIMIGELIPEIKDQLIRQCLILLYNHYNFINIMEIQRLKWIFYTDMYEGISLTQLSLFPDIEEIMLNYYEIIKLCVIPRPRNETILNNFILDVRHWMELNSSNRFVLKMCSGWQTINERNYVLNSKLIVLYNNMSMGILRNESTVYGRILSLKVKSIINEYILSLAFPDYNFRIEQNQEKNVPDFPFLNYFRKHESFENVKVNLDWKDFFKSIEIKDPDIDSRIDFSRLFLLEYLIKDSIYCLTEMLETVTPYTTTTLFTDAFMAGIYYSLYKWSHLFEELFLFYKVFDTFSYKNKKYTSMRGRLMDNFFENYDVLFKKDSSYSKEFENFKNYVLSINTDEIMDMAGILSKIWNCSNISDRFYKSVVTSISKPNVYYTLKNYAGEMALNFFRKAKDINREGQTYKDMINRMYFLDDDLKNDTIQFDLAVERFRINSGEIDKHINMIKEAIKPSIYDVDRFGPNTETELPLSDRFNDLGINLFNNNIN